MTDQQRRFAEEYVACMDPQEAYKRAYPHVKKDMSAAACASRLLNDAKFSALQAYIRELMDKAADNRVADRNEVLAYLTGVMRGSSEAEIVVTEGTGDGCSEARPMIKRPDEKERLKAAELLAKYHQLLIPKVQVEAEKSCGLIVLQEATDGEP